MDVHYEIQNLSPLALDVNNGLFIDCLRFINNDGNYVTPVIELSFLYYKITREIANHIYETYISYPGLC